MSVYLRDFSSGEPPSRAASVVQCLSELEAALQHCGRWSAQRPTAEALASSAPFCVDALDFCQWLQFVLIERLRALIERNGSLPALSGIAPMAEQVLALPADEKARLVAALVALDRALGAAPTAP